LNYLKEKSNYPHCNGTPLTQDKIMELKPGSVCYIISNAGLRLAMFSYHDKGKDGDNKVAFCVGSGVDKYKIKNAGKTYNLYKAIVS
jgi:hypothetical protein